MSFFDSFRENNNLKRQLADIFIAALNERPEDFVDGYGKFTIIDTKTDTEWWVANRGYGFSVHKPFNFQIGVPGKLFNYHGWRAYRAFKKWQNMPHKKLELEMEEAAAARAKIFAVKMLINKLNEKNITTSDSVGMSNHANEL